MTQIHARLNELLTYDPATGVFTRKVSLSNRAKLGALPVSKGRDGYLYGSFDGKRHLIHRLAWLFMTGEWPTAQVTHINGRGDDNRWVNLRHVTKAENLGARAARHRASTLRGMPDDTAEAAALVRRLFDYDPSTGVLVWREKASKYSPVKPGSVATTIDPKGYLRVVILKREFRAHRIAWLHHHGTWPTMEVDHINGDKADNRIANLRDVDRITNAQNLRSATAASSTGLLGAYRVNGLDRFDSALRLNGTTKKLGRFKSPEAAHKAYVNAKRKLHAGCTI